MFYVLYSGWAHPHGQMGPACLWLGLALRQNSSLARGCSLPPLSLPSAETAPGWGGGLVHPATFLGQVEDDSGSLHRHTHPETSQEWAPSSPSHPQGPAAQLQPVGFPRHPFKCPLLVPSGLKGAGPQEEGHCPCGLRHAMTGGRHEPGLQESQLKMEGLPWWPPRTGPLGPRCWTGSFCSKPGGEQMGPGPLPGHRAQLSTDHPVKTTTACPSPAQPRAPISSGSTMGVTRPSSVQPSMYVSISGLPVFHSMFFLPLFVVSSH